MLKRSFKQNLFETDLEKAQLTGSPFFSSANAVQGTALSPITSLPPTDLSGFLVVTVAFKRRRVQFYPVGQVKNTLPGIRLNKQQDPFCPFLSASCIEMCPHSMRCFSV